MKKKCSKSRLIDKVYVLHYYFIQLIWLMINKESLTVDSYEWICLEKECDLRLMSSKQAVKLHNKTHKVEEFSSLT